ncbi:DUF3889 domain-containing protein [Aquibacillus salsiterrae]|uniref:DUF3889 domain-containing protein n=1 Tax=Aquibacillus salsiterrae TaxID=2950439 RepID=A0A9X4AGR7_9BACI|nr:DUF3889 domain-containing protein [Aquibacillus salsiterrae]MDC3417413.1 DUF3889 domain-containing protein [Aquibacillus salsiterrae]
MYWNNYYPNGTAINPYVSPGYTKFFRHPYNMEESNYLRVVNGQATWTEGGPITQCGIPWSTNEYMTASVGTETTYRCGQTIKVRNSHLPQREVIVTVVDKVPGFPRNKINLHRQAFEALGADLSVGILNVTLEPNPQLEEERWGKYLLEITQTAYPNYNVTDYNFIKRVSLSERQIKETYHFFLKSQATQEIKRIKGNVIYNPDTDHINSFDIQEV